jgi:hypothetical protein
MAATYTLISSNVLSSSAATVSFTSIPADYTDLVAKWSVRDDNSGPNDLYIRLNNDSSSIYSRVLVMGDGSAPDSKINTAGSWIFGQRAVVGTAYTSNTFGTGELYIPSYTVSQNRQMSLDYTTENNATAAVRVAQASLYRSNTAISQITFSTAGVGSFVSGSSFYLYGISNA